jgi:hypothetical protein
VNDALPGQGRSFFWQVIQYKQEALVQVILSPSIHHTTNRRVLLGIQQNQNRF